MNIPNYNKTTEIPYEGEYWWNDAEKVDKHLRDIVNNVLSSDRISTITVTGTDFNDGKERRRHEIRIDETRKVIVVKTEYF